MSSNFKRSEFKGTIINDGSPLHTHDTGNRETSEVKRQRMGMGIRSARRVAPDRFREGEWVTGITVWNGYDESGWYKYRRREGKTEERYVGHGML